MRRIAATPCPVAAHQSIDFDDTITDGTTNIEYTTAFDASFRNVKPRRGQPMRRGAVNFTIHEDEEQQSESQKVNLARPPRRIIPTDQSLQIPAQIEVEPVAQSSKVSQPKAISAKRGLGSIAQQQEHVTTRFSSEYILQNNGYEPEKRKKASPGKRRNTLYIPPDDTTQPTMWMGIFSPLKHDSHENGDHQSSKDENLTGIAARMVQKRDRKSSSTESQVKRKPLRLSTYTLIQTNTTKDRAGEPTGKENVPPLRKSSQAVQNQKHSRAPSISTASKSDVDLQRKKFLSQARSRQASRQNALPENTVSDVATMYVVGNQENDIRKPELKDILSTTNSSINLNNEGYIIGSSTANTALVLGSQQPEDRLPLVPTKFVKPPAFQNPSIPSHVPIIDDIQNPSLYEESWLDHQEIVIKQLLNSLFHQVEHVHDRELKAPQLRAALIERYNSQKISLIYSRVQAATLYGSLSLTHEAMFNIQNLKYDVGRKRTFIKFWLNYNHHLLRIALEVISGKQISVRNRRSSQDSDCTPVSPTKSIAQFIESYILQHEDGHLKPAGTGVVKDLGSKTVLKSIMLLKALDLFKEESAELTTRPLFQKSSSFKSSTTALQCIMSMLNPAVGDPIRALRQLGCEVSYTQSPASEVVYKIDNLAVDVRDGVTLARLVEILLYGSNIRNLATSAGDDTRVLHLTNGDMVTIDIDQSSPLVQHLKLPCQSRATKLYNVQISLEALKHVRCMRLVTENVSLDDIVDGHREKTIALLWAMVGQFGISQLIDSGDLKWEINRLRRENPDDDEKLEGDTVFTSSQEEFEYLIKSWTKVVAASQGLTVRNFSTSFANGQIFRAIVDRYEPYLNEGHTLQNRPLDVRLSSLGCSHQFAKLFDIHSGQTYIFGQDFVLAALTFLCSRLLGPSQVCRSAIAIQRGWRRHWSKIARERQSIKRELADACAAATRMRQHTHKATTTETGIGKVPMIGTNNETEADIWLSV